MAREREYKFRVLVYPNITKKYNEIMKDSYIVLLPKGHQRNFKNK